MEIRNAKYATADTNGPINVEYNHPALGWIPFTSAPNDVEQLGKDIYQAALAMGPAAFVPIPLTENDYKDAVQAHIDYTASSPPPVGRNYADGNSCASYDGDPVVPQWAAEGAAFKAWRSTVWAYVYNQLYAVQNGQRAQPTIAELIAELPAMAWPAPG